MDDIGSGYGALPDLTRLSQCDQCTALQARVEELEAQRHQDALDGQAALEDRDQRIQELETRLDWNHMRHVGEPEDAAEDIAYLRNMLRLSNERVKELEGLKCSQPDGPSVCPLGPCKCYRCTGTPDADSYYEDAENNSAAGEG